MIGVRREIGGEIKNGKVKEAHITHAIADENSGAAITCSVENGLIFQTQKVVTTVIDEDGTVSQSVQSKSHLKNRTKGAAIGAAIGEGVKITL